MDEGINVNSNAIQDRMAKLSQEHSDLDASIMAITNKPGFDQLLVQRLKKRKLAIKDQIRILEDRMIPDIIA